MKRSKGKTQLDRRALASLTAALDELLSELVVTHAWPEVRSSIRAISELHRKIAKSDPLRSHLTWFDLFDVLGLFIRRYKILAQDDPRSIKLSKALDAERFAAFRSELVSYLSSIPRLYHLLVDLPAMPRWGRGEFQLTKRLTIIGADEPTEQPTVTLGGLARLQEPPPDVPKRVRARVACSGFSSGRISSTAIADALSHLKQFSYFFAQLPVYKSAALTLSGALRQDQLRCELVDVELPDEKTIVQLPEWLRRFLVLFSVNEEKLTFRELGQTLLGGEVRPANTMEEKIASLVE